MLMISSLSKLSSSSPSWLSGSSGGSTPMAAAISKRKERFFGHCPRLIFFLTSTQQPLTNHASTLSCLRPTGIDAVSKRQLSLSAGARNKNHAHGEGWNICPMVGKSRPTLGFLTTTTTMITTTDFRQETQTPPVECWPYQLSDQEKPAASWWEARLPHWTLHTLLRIPALPYPAKGQTQNQSYGEGTEASCHHPIRLHNPQAELEDLGAGNLPCYRVSSKRRSKYKLRHGCIGQACPDL